MKSHWFLASSLALALPLTLGGCSPDHDDDDREGRGYGGSASASTCAARTTCGTCTPIVGCGWCSYENGSGSCATGPGACKGDTFSWNWNPEDCSEAPTTPPTVDAGSADDAPIATPVDGGPAPASDAPAASDVPAASDAPAATDVPTDAATTDAAKSDAADADEDAATSDATATDAPSATNDAVASDTAADTAKPATDAPICKAPDVFATGCNRTMGGTLCADTSYTLGCHGAEAKPDPSLKCASALTSGSSIYYCCPCLP